MGGSPQLPADENKHIPYIVALALQEAQAHTDPEAQLAAYDAFRRQVWDIAERLDEGQAADDQQEAFEDAVDTWLVGRRGGKTLRLTKAEAAEVERLLEISTVREVYASARNEHDSTVSVGATIGAQAVSAEIRAYHETTTRISGEQVLAEVSCQLRVKHFDLAAVEALAAKIPAALPPRKLSYFLGLLLLPWDTTLTTLDSHVNLESIRP